VIPAGKQDDQDKQDGQDKGIACLSRFIYGPASTVLSITSFFDALMFFIFTQYLNVFLF
jgi:hypothetical protein